jgi:hypothetical protein
MSSWSVSAACSITATLDRPLDEHFLAFRVGADNHAGSATPAR